MIQVVKMIRILLHVYNRYTNAVQKQGKEFPKNKHKYKVFEYVLLPIVSFRG
jgi:hypothetical protein